MEMKWKRDRNSNQTKKEKGKRERIKEDRKMGGKKGGSSLSKADAKNKPDDETHLKEDATEKNDNKKRERESIGTPICNKNPMYQPTRGYDGCQNERNQYRRRR